MLGCWLAFPGLRGWVLSLSDWPHDSRVWVPVVGFNMQYTLMLFFLDSEWLDPPRLPFLNACARNGRIVLHFLLCCLFEPNKPEACA